VKWEKSLRIGEPSVKSFDGREKRGGNRYLSARRRGEKESVCFKKGKRPVFNQERASRPFMGGARVRKKEGCSKRQVQEGIWPDFQAK